MQYREYAGYVLSAFGQLHCVVELTCLMLEAEMITRALKKSSASEYWEVPSADSAISAT